ncbi:MAG: hypothetical protein JWO31_957 [Phycisphaerales bacterium]|nr:hypothetical protein [Phycisphaerales bacterium]
MGPEQAAELADLVAGLYDGTGPRVVDLLRDSLTPYSSAAAEPAVLQYCRTHDKLNVPSLIRAIAEADAWKRPPATSVSREEKKRADASHDRARAVCEAMSDDELAAYIEAAFHDNPGLRSFIRDGDARGSTVVRALIAARVAAPGGPPDGH